MSIRDKIIKKISSGELAFAEERKIFSALNIHPAERKHVKKILNELEDDGILMRDSQGGFATPEQVGAFTGVVQGNERGFAFIIPDDKEARPNDYFVPRRALCGALNKDRVLAAHKRGTEDEAYVIKILERGMKRVVGTFEKDRRAGYVIPDDAKFDSDVFIPLSLCGNAKAGDKVVAEITSYPKDKMVGGKIVEVLGESGDFYTEELSIIRSYSLNQTFPSSVERAAQEVSRQPIVLEKRKDFRDFLTITIDGEDTRDIDDAISLERQGDNFILGVHIADVSHYVKYGDKIDREAYDRGTSVYFPDMVLPMLPKALSNGACSLNEGEDRYATSCVMTFDKHGKKLKSEFYESIICSNRRMTYTAVTAILDGDRDACEKYADIAPMLKDAEELCLALENRREKSGSVNLDVKEAHIYVDENGEIIIPDYERSISHRIIEQFMVSANESVAEFLQNKKAPCLYRVHEKPSPEKANNFFAFLKDLGVNASGNTEELKPTDFQRVLNGVEGKPYASVVNRVMLRSMQKARYCEENLGHFGLASECYCHFTSPIRRYPDLFVHRVLKLLINGEGATAERIFSSIAHDAAVDASERERRADMAERDVDDLYKVVYMQDRIGEEFDAVISGVTNFALFAELPNTIEGIIRLETLPQDNYAFVEEKFLLKGINHSYKIGDPVKIKVAGCDYGSMRVEFILS
ncbi:MAG: ribonuclease R [Candidatus Coproplasma sp.]